MNNGSADHRIGLWLGFCGFLWGLTVLPIYAANTIPQAVSLPSLQSAGQNPSYELSALTEINLTARPELPDLSAYTVAAVRARRPVQMTGRTAQLMPIKQLYFIPDSNIWDMQRIWKKKGRTDPDCIVLGRGDYTLASVYEQINDPAILAKEGEREYLLSRPLYIAPSASLTIQDGDWLKLSSVDGVFIIYNGDFYATDARVSAWDKDVNDIGERDPLHKENVLLYGVQTPRPYLLGLEGSQTYAANSAFIGLGYKGASGTFGLSLSSTVGHSGLGRYLSSLAKPTGWLVGNYIENLYFGFYSTQASRVVIVGNEFANNLIYGIDPHDYSDQLIIARNVAHGSQFSHGIIVSREVNDSWITQNISLHNAGSGIMLDRMSSNNTVSDNILYANHGDGIAAFESDNNSIHHNLIARNERNGVYVRNSLDVDVYNNEIHKNGRNGIEVAGVNIDIMETRDFVLDPYHMSTSAVLLQNQFEDNFNSAIAAKSIQKLTLFENQYWASGPLYFSGDLEDFAAQLLRHELKRQQPIALQNTLTQNVAQHSSSKQSAAVSGSRETLQRLAEQGVPRAMLALARLYAQDDRPLHETVYWYGRAILHSRPSAMRDLGLLLMTHKPFLSQQWSEGLTLFNMAALMGDARASLDLLLLPDIIEVSLEQLAKAKKAAARRLREGQFWNAKLFPDIKIRLVAEEARLATKRARRISAAFRARSKADSQATLTKLAKQAYTEDDYIDVWRKDSDKNQKLRNLRVAAQKTLDQQATGEQQAYLDRVSERQESARARLNQLPEKERQVLLKRFEIVLKLVNYHRSENAKISLDPLTLRLSKKGLAQ